MREAKCSLQPKKYAEGLGHSVDDLGQASEWQKLAALCLSAIGSTRPFAAGGYTRVEWLVMVGLRPLESRRLAVKAVRTDIP